MVYFAAHEGYNRNLLGRHGWLNRVRLGLIDYEGKLYLNHADEETPDDLSEMKPERWRQIEGCPVRGRERELEARPAFLAEGLRC